MAIVPDGSPEREYDEDDDDVEVHDCEYDVNDDDENDPVMKPTTMRWPKAALQRLLPRTRAGRLTAHSVHGMSSRTLPETSRNHRKPPETPERNCISLYETVNRSSGGVPQE